MSGIYGWNSGNSFMNSFFGTGGSGSGPSLLSSLGDLQMIKSGAYKKAMKAYYANQVSQSKTDGKDTDTISGSGTADSKVKLSNLKSSAQKLYESANALKMRTIPKMQNRKICLVRQRVLLTVITVHCQRRKI